MGIETQIQNEVNETRVGQSRVGKIKTYMANNLTNDLSIAAVSQKFELSASTLRHIFKDHQQQSYRHYLEGLRMDKALELLKEGKWVKEVMAATGYTNRSTFNIAFKKRYKYPASHFKK
jgi:AraC-like DNA-binding protein